MQGAKFNILIAADARIGGTTSTVLRTEIIQNLTFVFFSHRNSIMRYAKAFCHSLRLGDIFIFTRTKATFTTFHMGHVLDRAIPRGHGYANDFVALFFQKISRKSRVNTTGKAYGHTFLRGFHIHT